MLLDFVVITVKLYIIFYDLKVIILYDIFFFFSSRRRHTRSKRDWSSDVCSSDLPSRTPTRRPGRAQRSSDDGSLYEAQRVGVRDGLRSRRCPELAVHGVGLGLDRVGGDLKIGRASCRERV